MNRDSEFPSGYRYFENVVPAQNVEKFYAFSVSMEGPTFCVRTYYGRIGTRGTSLKNSFGSAEAAQAFIEKKMSEKLRKGYQARDLDWVVGMWGTWRPPYPRGIKTPSEALETLRGSGALRASQVEDKRREFIRIAADEIVSQPVAVQTRERAERGRRVIDFTEED